MILVGLVKTIYKSTAKMVGRFASYNLRMAACVVLILALAVRLNQALGLFFNNCDTHNYVHGHACKQLQVKCVPSYS